MRRTILCAPLLCLMLTGCVSHNRGGNETSDALCAQGKTLLAAGKIQEARNAYRSATYRDGENERAWNGLGVADEMGGKMVEAENAYRRALELVPDDLTALNNLSHLYIATGDADDAVRLLEPYADDPKAPASLRANLAAARKAVGDTTATVIVEKPTEETAPAVAAAPPTAGADAVAGTAAPAAVIPPVSVAMTDADKPVAAADPVAVPAPDLAVAADAAPAAAATTVPAATVTETASAPVAPPVATDAPAAAADAGYADLGSYQSIGIAQNHLKEAQGLLGDDGKNVTFAVVPEFKVTGGTAVFTVEATGQPPQSICDNLTANAFPCIAQDKQPD